LPHFISAVNFNCFSFISSFKINIVKGNEIVTGECAALVNDSTKHYAKTVEHDGEGVIVVTSTKTFNQKEANQAVEEYMA